MTKILPITQKIDTLYATENLIVRLSFYDASLDTEMCPVIYSAEKEILASDIASLKPLQITWLDTELPNLVTAYNTIALASQSFSILVLIWGRFNTDGGRTNPDFLLG